MATESLQDSKIWQGTSNVIRVTLESGYTFTGFATRFSVIDPSSGDTVLELNSVDDAARFDVSDVETGDGRICEITLYRSDTSALTIANKTKEYIWHIDSWSLSNSEINYTHSPESARFTIIKDVRSGVV